MPRFSNLDAAINNFRSVIQLERDSPVQNRSENTPQKNPQTMSRSEWKPREPPTFSGRLKEDVHQWTAIVTQYFAMVPGTNQQQLTYAVSLLRGYAIDWYNTEVKRITLQTGKVLQTL